MTIHQTSLGYWYPRTTMHLAELYDFLRQGKSPLALRASRLKLLKEELAIQSVELKIDVLEYIEAKSESGIQIKIHEDGLVVLTDDNPNPHTAINSLRHYFEKRFSPAINYLFSLGAPVPKELADIQTVFPYFIVTSGIKESDVGQLLKEVGGEPDFEIVSDQIDIYKGQQLFILNAGKKFANINGLIEMLIFFKEFKAQLHHYLNLHRTIWEEIADIKEKGFIRGKEVQGLRNQLESYKKTVELIEGRINQMGIYMSAREDLVKSNGWEEMLTKILASRYQNLRHSLDYVKSLWSMTNKYLDSAVQIFNEINALSTRNSFRP